MEILWANANKEFTGREVADQLPHYAYTTVTTVLNRLSKKGAVRRRMEQNTTRFWAVASQESRAAMAMRAALEESGDVVGTLAKFVQSMSEDELGALRTALSRSNQ
jgi:predicted transcriptional regulator